jgi:hypothetical protein
LIFESKRFGFLYLSSVSVVAPAFVVIQPAKTILPKLIKCDLEVKEEITRTAVPQTSLPPKFPEGIPIEKNAEILTNLHVTTPSGGFQSTRMFVTQESLDDNFTLYKQYFMSNNWVIASSSNSDPKLKQISARKDDLLVQVVLNEVPTRKTVEINVQKAE